MPIFGKGGPKNPQELVKGLKDALSVLAQPGGGAKKAEKVNILLKFKTNIFNFFSFNQATEEASKLLQQMKLVLYGSGGTYMIY